MVSKYIKNPGQRTGVVINPNWKNWEWVDIGIGISKPLPLDPLPGIAGNVIGSGATEFTNDQVGKKIDETGRKK